MPIVDENRLKGNYGAAYVAARLSSECLVRPVAAETDVGVDLYCETVESGIPFLHFWMQVKAGAQCRVTEDGSSASCSFPIEKLEYWSRQPVPVFAALVPVEWPVTEDPPIFIVDITSQLLFNELPHNNSITLTSDYVLRPNNRDDVRRFLTEFVPITTARLACKYGIIGSRPSLQPSYVRSSPVVPVTKFKPEILHRIRLTAAQSIIFLYETGEINNNAHAEFRRILAAVVEQYGDDPHWENFYARALSYHADSNFQRAIEFYQKAINCIQSDPNVRGEELWQNLVQEIEQQREKAQRQENV